MEGIQYVYFEKVMFINISMNWLILWLAGRLGRVSAPAWRMLAGAFFGALYSFTLLLPELQWLVNFSTKVVFSVLMLGIAFYPLPLARAWRVILYFYLTSFAVGGAIFGLSFLAVPGTTAGNILSPLFHSMLKALDDHLWWLFPLVVLGALTFGYWAPVLGKHLVQTFCRVPFVIVVDGKEKALVGLLDTGNQMRDPLSQSPVLIVELEAIRELLPSGIQDKIREPMAPEIWELITEIEPESNWPERWRVLPFTSVGQAKGVLLGFRPDYIEIHRGITRVKEQQVVVGLYTRSLSGDGSYRALLPADWLELLGRDTSGS